VDKPSFQPVVFVPEQYPPAGEPPPRSRRERVTITRIGAELLAWGKTLVSAAVYAVLIVTFGFQVARVEGMSMQPTLQDQDRLLVNKAAYLFSKPAIGDIVMLNYPRQPDKYFVKRVVAKEFQTVKVVNGRVFVDGNPVPDGFIPDEYIDHSENLPSHTVPEGYYYVMGDHRNNSSDSRFWDDVPQKYILGRVDLRWWPLNQAQWFRYGTR
jgi:signal peptidase I